MMYFCEVDGKPDCRTWDQCHHRGVCLAKPHALAPLNAIADAVLRYKPPAKAKATKARAKRRRKRDAKKG